MELVYWILETAWRVGAFQLMEATEPLLSACDTVSTSPANSLPTLIFFYSVKMCKWFTIPAEKQGLN